MTQLIWDPGAREFLRKLPRNVANRIYNKVGNKVKDNVQRYLETLVGIEGYKIRVGDYRLFADYFKDRNLLVIRAIRHRKDAYKK